MNIEKINKKNSGLEVIPKDKIGKILSDMFENDQRVRLKENKTGEDYDIWIETDKYNREKLKEIIRQHGWDILFADSKNILHSWIITQHDNDDIDFQKKFFEKFNDVFGDLEKRIKDKKEMRAIRQHRSMLEDRILSNEYGFQKYGSQRRKIDLRKDVYEVVPVLEDESFDFNSTLRLNNIKEWESYFDGQRFLNLDLKENRDILNERREKAGFPDSIEESVEDVRIVFSEDDIKN